MKSQTKLLAMGTCCVDVYPQKDVVTPGGEALNIAAQLSERKDVAVSLMAMLGNDPYGQIIRDSIANLPINTDHLSTMEGETAHHIIHISEDGDRYFKSGAWHGGVCTELVLDHRHEELLDETDIVITTLWQPNLKKLCELKHQFGYLLAVDFNEQRDLSDWEELIPTIDVFFISAEQSLEPEFLARSQDTETLFVLTYSAEGSAALHKGNTYRCTAEPVAEVIDTTGCGDCFQGHFISTYFQTGDIQTAMQRGSQEAAQVTQYVGGFKTT